MTNMHDGKVFDYDLGANPPTVAMSKLQPTFAGRVTPQADMIEAARRDLSPEGFDDLMRETGGRPPTPAELCAKVDAARRVAA